MAMQKTMMDFFLEKDIATLTMLYVNLQLEGIDQHRMTMRKKIRKLWKALSLKRIVIARIMRDGRI
jgi:hypothetical protein